MGSDRRRPAIRSPKSVVCSLKSVV